MTVDSGDSVARGRAAGVVRYTRCRATLVTTAHAIQVRTMLVDWRQGQVEGEREMMDV